MTFRESGLDELGVVTPSSGARDEDRGEDPHGTVGRVALTA